MELNTFHNVFFINHTEWKMVDSLALGIGFRTIFNKNLSSAGSVLNSISIASDM